MFNEYPKMLYRGDEARPVDCLSGEQAAKQEGWHEFGEDPQEKPRRGRPPGSANKSKGE